MMVESFMPPQPLHPGADWHKAIAARDEQRARDYERVSAKLEAEAKAKEERENAEVRERVAEDQARRMQPQ
jgi:hypothetical protein